MRRGIVAAGAAVLLLAGCSGEGQVETPVPTVEVTEAPQVTEETPTPSPEAEAPQATGPSGEMAYVCGEFYAGGEQGLAFEIPPLMIDFPETLTDETIQPYLSMSTRLGGLVLRAPAELRGLVEDIREPFAAIQAIYDNPPEDGDITLDTSMVAGAVMELTGVCADAGFKIDQN
ncbi:MAG: hypothetical protein Q4F67_12190 [Propionibacteriaceae bacterium]|nr:hypothetical protein [Propionibacteriaceae bacterium]